MTSILSLIVLSSYFLLGSADKPAKPANLNFIGLGDSCAAGIGAGSPYNNGQFGSYGCYQYENAYAWQLGPNLHQGGSSIGLPYLNVSAHISCSGALIDHVTGPGPHNGSGLGPQLSQIALMEKVVDNIGWGTLSIGGNDVGFGSIAQHCLLLKSSDACTKDLADAETKINGIQLRLVDVYTKVMNAAKNDDFKLVITGYATFFNDSNKDCDDKWLGPWGMYLKQELRSQVNGLVKQMNNNIQAAIKTVDGNFTTESIVYADWDAAFEGHRFCEPANKNWKSDAWFLTINGDDTTAAGVTTAANTNGTNSTEIDLKAYATTCQKSVNQTESDDMTTINEQILCDYAVGMANGSIPYDPDFNGNITTLEAVCQALHPKSVAHNTTAKVIRDLILGANSRSTTPAPPPIDTNSPACEACEKVLGASNCAASDLTCLRNQRSGDSNCKTCGYNCSTVGA